MGAEGEPPSEKDTEEIRSRIKNYMRENGQGKREGRRVYLRILAFLSQSASAMTHDLRRS